MSKFLTILITALVVAGITLCLVFGIQCSNNETDKADAYKIEYLDSEYIIGEDIVYRFTAYSDIRFTKMTYKLSAAEEKTISRIKSEETADGNKLGKYYYDTKVQIIESAEMSEAYYTLSFYGYDEENNRYEITKTPYSFKLNAVAA